MHHAFPSTVEVREVGPRDGLQNEDPIPVDDRIRLVDALSGTGLRRIEAASFVKPEAIPAMAGAEEVMARIDRRPGVVYSALVPNARGAERALAADADERALAADADELQVVVSASETHNRKNVRRSVDESITGVGEVIDLVGREGDRPVEAIVSTAFGCPYEGDVDPAGVAAVTLRLISQGVDRCSFGDTTGMATPRRVDDLLDALEDVGLVPTAVGLHLHNTRGTGLANVLAGLERGVTRFDASIGGLGGCPYAPGATGNIVTEDLVHMLADMGVDTGVDIDALLAAAHLAQDLVGRELPGQVMRAGPRSRVVSA